VLSHRSDRRTRPGTDRTDPARNESVVSPISRTRQCRFA
jgi:hypothetical protein